MDIRDEKPSKHYEVRRRALENVIADKLRTFGIDIGEDPSLDPDYKPPVVSKLNNTKGLFDEENGYVPYGGSIKVGGMWGNKPTELNGQEIFESQYGQFGYKTPFTDDMLAATIDRYLNPEHPGTSPDWHEERRKWGTNGR